MIFPEDVILQRVNLSVYEVIDHCGRKYYTTDEQSARYASCTHVHCCECGKPVKKPKFRCDECSMKSVPEWDGEYPIFIGDQFFENEDDLGEWLEDQEITKEELQAEKNCIQHIRIWHQKLMSVMKTCWRKIKSCQRIFRNALISSNVNLLNSKNQYHGVLLSMLSLRANKSKHCFRRKGIESR